MALDREGSQITPEVMDDSLLTPHLIVNFGNNYPREGIKRFYPLKGITMVLYIPRGIAVA
jgi:hypothetical protein